jgi:spore germination protein GerM
MKNRQNTIYNHLLTSKAFIVSSVLLILTLLLAACGSNTSSNPPAGSTSTPANTTPTATTGASPAVTTATATTATHYPVKVYFSKSPDSEHNFQAVYPVNRDSPTSAVATYAIQQLIAGPTSVEKNAGYYSELPKALSGPSSCSGADFTLALDKKGTTDEPGTATLKFCRTLTSGGIGTDARIHTEIETTLKQFPTIKKVIILTNEGHCFGDESGMDRCLQ